MILSLAVYITLAGILWLLAKDQQLMIGRNLSDLQRTFWKWQNIAAFLIFALLYGIRYNVGVDNLSYIEIYEGTAKGLTVRSDSLEIGYDLIQHTFIDLDLHYSVFIGLWGFMQIALIYYGLRKDKYLLPYVALFMILGPAWLRMANIMRQAVVECAFIVLIEFITKKQFLKYLIGIGICFLIHKSAIILLPFYFIFQKTIFPKNKWIGVGCILICTLIGSSPVWIQSMNFIDSILVFLDYDSYSQNFEDIMNDQENFRAWGPARAGLWILYLFTTWIFLSLRNKYHFNIRYDLYFECFFFGCCLYELFANTSQIFIRPISYFQSFSIVVVPICLYYLNKSRHYYKYGLMCFLAYFNTIWWTIKAYIGNGIGEAAPEVYKFFFLQ